MALKAKLDTLEGLSEDVQKEYKKSPDGDFFILDVEATDGLSLENVSGLKSALSKERQSVSELTSSLETAQSNELSTKEKLKKMSKLDPSKDAEILATEKFKTLESTLIEKHTTQMTEKDLEISGLRGDVDSLVRVSAISASLSNEKAFPESVDLLTTELLKRTKLEKGEDGKFAVIVLDTDGKTPLVLDGAGKKAALSDLVSEVKTSRPRLFEGTGHSGGGTPPEGDGGTPGLKRSTMDNAAKSKYIADHGLDQYEALER